MKYLMFLLVPLFLVLHSCDDEVACTTIGAPCDDGIDETYNDAYNADCDCEGNLNVFTDPRDGNQYRVVKIGTQIWMAENLKYMPTSGTSLCYNNSDSNCDVYGRLYNWSAANIAAPGGWHVPTDSEWTTLVNFLGGESQAGGKMKEAGTVHWSSPNNEATNSSGFNGLPAGAKFGLLGYASLGTKAHFWSSTEDTPGRAWHRYLFNFDGEVRRLSYDQDELLSIRLLRN